MKRDARKKDSRFFDFRGKGIGNFTAVTRLERWSKGDTILITKSQLEYLPSTSILAAQGYMGYWWEVSDEETDI